MSIVHAMAPVMSAGDMCATRLLTRTRIASRAARTCPEQQVVKLLIAAVRALHGAIHSEELEAERRGGFIHVEAVQGHAVGRAILAAVALLRDERPEAWLLIAGEERACC